MSGPTRQRPRYRPRPRDCSDNVQPQLYNQPDVIRRLAPFAAVVLTASALFSAGAAMADPPSWGRDQRDDSHGGYARPPYERGGFGEGAQVADPRPWAQRERRVDPREGYARPAYDGGAAERRFLPQQGSRYPGSPGAQWRQQQDEAQFGVNEGRLAPLGRVIESIGRRTPGRQLDAGIEHLGGRPVYRVRWMSHDGRRIDYIVDAATGTIISGH